MSSPAHADISPPPGYEWLKGTRITVTNASAFPDYVFVAWPCYSSHLIQEYCVLEPNRAIEVNGQLFALAARDVKVAPKKEWNAELAREYGPAPWTLYQPDIPTEKAFFQNDSHVIRPGFQLDHRWTHAVPRSSGIDSAEFFVEITKVDEHGVSARFARVKYTCAKGAPIELGFNPGSTEPPIPICPVTDDKGELMSFADGGKVSSGTTSALPPPWQSYRRTPLAPEQMIWGGAIAVSLSLVGAGLLLRERRKPTE